MAAIALAGLLFGIAVPAKASEGPTVSVKPFGQTGDGRSVELYTLASPAGMKVGIMTYGATIVDLWVPDREGNLADVALGFDDFAPYLDKSPYFGCIVGRYANRIAKGRFTLDGKTCDLARNNGENHLHGGDRGFDKQVWTAETPESKHPSVRFKLRSPDGQEGYPGTLDAEVTYTLTDRGALHIAYKATTDKPTVVNLTNHTYFNLAGAGSGSILDHRLSIDAAHFTPVDDTLIPTGELEPVEGTVMDFRRPTAIGARIAQVDGQPVGYDHNYVLNRSPEKARSPKAAVYEPISGRRMTVYTDQPGIQFYSGNFLDGTVTGKGGKVYRQYDGFCLETQHFPDSPNRPQFPAVVLRPGQTYRTTTVYQFSVK